MIQRRNQKENAVSPVVGVMLMIVVTILIAAVVAAFVGGMAGDTKKSPTAIFGVADVNLSHDSKNKDQFGFLQNLTLVHKGGDYIQLSDIEVVLTSDEGRSYTYTYGGHKYEDMKYDSKSKKVGSIKCNDTILLNDIGHDASKAIMTSGDSFTLVHNVCDTPLMPSKWKSQPTHFALNTPVTYSVIDMPTGNRIAEGTFIVSA